MEPERHQYLYIRAVYCYSARVDAWKGDAKVLEERTESTMNVSEHTILLELLAYRDVILSRYHS